MDVRHQILDLFRHDPGDAHGKVAPEEKEDVLLNRQGRLVRWHAFQGRRCLAVYAGLHEMLGRVLYVIEHGVLIHAA